jgi:DNA-binding winged helix-turn-helix (wHTH) protein
MSPASADRRYRFGVFEADATTGELRRQGLRIRLHAQPFQLLLLLLERPGAVLTRDEIARELWPGDTFVDYEHGVNSAVNRLREALGDRAGNPRFVETLARRGYRFVAPVESIGPGAAVPLHTIAEEPRLGERAGVEAPATLDCLAVATVPTSVLHRVLTSPDDLPRTSQALAQNLYLMFQLMYLAFYVGALGNLPEIGELVSALPLARVAFLGVIVTAALLIPVRASLLCAVLLRAPGLRTKLLRLWSWLLPLDLLWSLAPFLLLHHINFGIALACTTLLVYSPFAQRSLVLMGAGERRAHPEQNLS